jgi:hypothetical protein
MKYTIEYDAKSYFTSLIRGNKTIWYIHMKEHFHKLDNLISLLNAL